MSFTHLGICPRSMSPQLVSRGVTGDCVKSPAKAESNGMCCVPFVHKISHPIVEGNWVGQAQFVLGKSMLVVPSHLLLLPENSSCEDFSSGIFTGTKMMLTIL